MILMVHAFDRLMKLLRSINPDIELPPQLEPLLRNEMDEIHPVHHEVLVHQGDLPLYAYYIIRGYVYVTYICDAGVRHVLRFYRSNSIVAFLSFLEQKASPYTICAGKDTILSRVRITTMKKVYLITGMYEFAQRTVMLYDAAKEKLREDMMGLPVPERVRMFYKVYPFLLPAESARMDLFVAAFLKISDSTLYRTRYSVI